MAEKMGVTVKGFYWTVGQYDLVLILEGSDESVTSALLKVSSFGNIRTQTLRAFGADEMQRILAKMA